MSQRLQPYNEHLLYFKIATIMLKEILNFVILGCNAFRRFVGILQGAYEYS